MRARVAGEGPPRAHVMLVSLLLLVNDDRGWFPVQHAIGRTDVAWAGWETTCRFRGRLLMP